MVKTKVEITHEEAVKAEEKLEDVSEEIIGVEEENISETRENAPEQAETEKQIEVIDNLEFVTEADEVVEDDEMKLDITAEENQKEAGAAAVSKRKGKPSRLARVEERARKQQENQSTLTNESALRSAIRTHKVFSDQVAAVEVFAYEGQTQIAAIVVLEKAFKVIIPFNELFTVNPIKAEEIDRNTADGRYEYMRRTRQFAERMIGGTIPFCITAAENVDGNLVMLGSRAKAMERQSQIFFGGSNPRYKEGDVVEATLTSVNVHSVVALIGGVDVVIPQHQLTRRWCLDLHDRYAVGDTILAKIRSVSKDSSGAVKVTLDPISIELEDAKSRYNIIRNGGRTKGVITNVLRRVSPNGENVGINIYAYLPSFDLYARVIRINANSFGRKMTAGTQVMVRVIDHHESGYLICEAMYDHGNNSMFKI